ncbi:hypothetical protein U1Q18_030136 [Sarracenia purpurea var. burkii]
MADSGSSSPSPTDKFRKPISSMFSSPKFFTGFVPKCFTDIEPIQSPTSILDSKPFSTRRNPFFPKPENRIQRQKLDSRRVGLGIVDALSEELSDDPNQSKPKSRMILFGSQLKIQIPPPLLLPPSLRSPDESLKSSPAIDFGIKTRNSQLGSFSAGLSHSPGKRSPFGSANSGSENSNSARVFVGGFSGSEMQLSEDYTCVISHGPNPRTTHIFDNCIVESCCGGGGGGISGGRKEIGFCSYGNRLSNYPSESFLSFCYSCKKNLGEGKDIYIYRGEKAFCSSECRQREMMMEEGIPKMESGG